jgi:hypothetical protein
LGKKDVTAPEKLVKSCPDLKRLNIRSSGVSDTAALFSALIFAGLRRYDR